MELIFDGEYQLSEEMVSVFNTAAKMCLEAEGISNDKIEISITFVSDEEIMEINNDYRGINKVTDVLSFPQYESSNEVPEEGVCILGDVVISINKAREQAIDFGHSLNRELVYLYVHSLFHLLGYDHMNEDEKSIMREREESVMSSLGLER
ncbi:MAG: rRNA maturation RNase YbeY [Anaerovoracaceae bacterium]